MGLPYMLRRGNGFAAARFVSRSHCQSAGPDVAVIFCKATSRTLGLLYGLAILAFAAIPGHANENDYPTSARADYVIACMAANGNTREALLKCSCAIDTIAGLMPYSHYEQADTALSFQAGGVAGDRIGLFRDPPPVKAVIEELRRAQAEANLQCQ